MVELFLSGVDMMLMTFNLFWFLVTLSILISVNYLYNEMTNKSKVHWIISVINYLLSLGLIYVLILCTRNIVYLIFLI